MSSAMIVPMIKPSGPMSRQQSLTRSDQRIVTPTAAPASPGSSTTRSRRSISPLPPAQQKTLSLSGFIFSVMILFINLQLHRALTATTTDRYTGLRRVTQIEAGEVDQLWETGKDLGSQLEDVQKTLEEVKHQRAQLEEDQEHERAAFVQQILGDVPP